MNAIESPHALPGDHGNGHGTAAQHIASEVLSLRAGHDDHETRIVAVERRYALVPFTAAVAVLILGAMLGLVHYARELVQHLPR